MHKKPKTQVNKDKIAFCKDQFSIYLPLTLRFKEGSSYARSEDGSRTLPCFNGEKHDAKRGTLLEQVNYTIQDYLQKGITLFDLRPWLFDLKHQWDETEDPDEQARLLQQFQAILPEMTLVEAVTRLHTQEPAQTLIDLINQDPSKIKMFLKIRLRQLKTSGALISMDPQNMIDMSRAVSGVSATMGAAESLHRQFHVNSDMNGRIQAGMIYRLKRRAAQEEVIPYDPEQPAAMLQTHPVHAIIDGAGAFNDSQQAAEALKGSNSGLEQVGYHQEDKSIAFIGNQTGELKKSGFFFSQPYTRGTDIPLAPDASAILTLNDKDGIREYCQKEGRLRKDRQRYHLAMPKYQEIKTISQEIAHAVAQDSSVDAKDIYRKCKQELESILRKALKKQLIAAQTPADFVTLFQNEEIRQFFMTKPEPYFEAEGSYFTARQQIQLENQKPKDTLPMLKANLLQKAQAQGLQEAVEQLQTITYSQELLAKMPDQVAPLGAAQGELEVEVQIEQEEEMEMEEEQELQIETQTEMFKVQESQPLGTYPIRQISNLSHSVKDKIYAAYDERLQVTDNFLPFSRMDSASLYQRRPFDETMYRVGEIYIKLDLHQGKTTIQRVTIEDPLKDKNIERDHSFCYDIRTNKLLSDIYIRSELQAVLQSADFSSLTAQIKFFDGRFSGHSEAELNALAAWLPANDLERMKNHFFNEILRYRYQDKQAFIGSQLHQLFERLNMR